MQNDLPFDGTQFSLQSNQGQKEKKEKSEGNSPDVPHPWIEWTVS